MPYPSRSPFNSARRREVLAWLGALPAAWLASGCQQNSAVALVGQDFPNLRLTDLQGGYRQFDELRGSPAILNIWATWCGPCREEMAGLEGLHQALRPKGLALVGISVDEDLNLVKEYVRYARITFPIWSDPRGAAVFNLLPSRALPTTVMIGSSGRVHRVVLGAHAWMDGTARKWVEELLV